MPRTARLKVAKLYISRLTTLRNSLLVLIFSMFIACNAHTINVEKSNKLQQIIRTQIHPYVIKYIEYDDGRPKYDKETKDVSDLLRRCFERRFLIRQDNKESLRKKALNLYYKHRRGAIEDGSAVYMTALNRSAVFASLSLISDELRQSGFINDANESLGDLQPDFSLHHMFYLMLDWIYAIEERNERFITHNYNLLYEVASKQSYPKAFYEMVSDLYSYCENEDLFLYNYKPLSEKNISDIFDQPY